MGYLDIKSHNIRKLAVLILITTIILITVAFVFTLHLTFGQEIRHNQNKTKILLNPVGPPIDNIKESFTKQLEDMINRVGNEDNN